jgi:hypothetical protein
VVGPPVLRSPRGQLQKDSARRRTEPAGRGRSTRAVKG